MIEDRLQETLAALAADRERRASEPWAPDVEMPIPPPMRLDINICPMCRRKGVTWITDEEPTHLYLGCEKWETRALRAWIAEPCGCYIHRSYWQVWIYREWGTDLVLREWEPLDPRTGQPLAPSPARRLAR